MNTAHARRCRVAVYRARAQVWDIRALLAGSDILTTDRRYWPLVRLMAQARAHRDPWWSRRFAIGNELRVARMLEVQRMHRHHQRTMVFAH